MSKLVNSCVSRRDTEKRIEAFLLRSASLAKNFNSDIFLLNAEKEKTRAAPARVLSIVEVLIISLCITGDKRACRH